MKKNPQIDSCGNKRWINDKGDFHRTDGPAFIRHDGREYWWINGKLIKPIPNIICVLRKKLRDA